MSLARESDDRTISTRETAAAFIEDMRHLRDVVNKPDATELRRLTNILRRLLIDGDLGKIAAPRIGRFEVLSPDNKPFLNFQYEFFGSASVICFGIYVRAASVQTTAAKQPNVAGFDPNRTVELGLHNFLRQRVLCFQNQWVTRQQAIKYIAHIGSGVHSGVAKEGIDKAIARIRKCAAYRAIGDTCNLSFDIAAFGQKEPPFRYTPEAIDPVLVEVLAAGHFLQLSPDIRRLEDDIRSEFAAPGS
jgi:hypothetical protein